MKRLFLASALLTFFSFSVILFQVSCQKDASAQDRTNCLGAQPTFKFKVNGTLYDCSALFDSRVGWYGNTSSSSVTNLIEGELPHISKESTAYTFSGGNVSAHLNFISFSTAAPAVGTISVTNGSSDCSIPSFTLCTKATYTITFTRVSNGTADGTFSGTTWNPATPGNVATITEGTFSNIMVIQ